MNNQEGRVTPTGTELETWETFKVHFDRSQFEPNEFKVSSKAISAFGGQWILSIAAQVAQQGFAFGGGNSDNGPNAPRPGGLFGEPNSSVNPFGPATASIKLLHADGDDANIEFTLSFGGHFARRSVHIKHGQMVNGMGTNVWKVKRDALFSRPSSGFSFRPSRRELEIVVRMRDLSSQEDVLPHYLQNPFRKNVLKKFNDEESSDIAFKVGDEGTIFHAHRFTLAACASRLGELCGSDSMAPISIPDVKSDVFHHMLYFVYGGKISEDDLKANAKDIINAADKYEIVCLKLQAEAAFVELTDVTVNNVKELFLYATEKHCALLKEAAVDFMVANRREILERVPLTDLPGSVVGDVFAALESSEGGGDSFATMRVTELRNRLYQKGLNIDGTRESMIAALEDS